MANSLDPDQAILSGLIWIETVCAVYQLVGNLFKLLPLNSSQKKSGIWYKISNAFFSKCSLGWKSHNACQDSKNYKQDPDQAV